MQIIGTLYSVLYAFATYVIWGQFTAVENEIQKESGALKDLLLFSNRMKPNTREPIVRAVVDGEWPALSNQESTENTDRLFTEVIASVTDAKPEDETERIVYERLLDIAHQASTHRDERLALSVKRMPRKLFLLFFYPFHNAALGLMSIAIATILLYFAHFVLTDLDNPFEGTWNVGNGAFEELLSKFR